MRVFNSFISIKIYSKLLEQTYAFIKSLLYNKKAVIGLDLDAFINLHKEFLKECEQKGWNVEVLIEEFGNHLTIIKNKDGIEVQFFIEVDFDKMKKLNSNKYLSTLDYGVIREEGKGDTFAKEVLHAFHSFMTKHLPRRKYIYYNP